MKFNIAARNIELTDSLKATVEEKLSKLNRYFKEETIVNVTMTVEKDRQKIEVTIPVKGHIIRSEQVTNDMYASIDMVEEVIERQMRKYRTKLANRYQHNRSQVEFSEDYLEVEDNDNDEEVKIIRSKKFGIKPMYPEDACIQMELLGHNFYVFRNAQTEEVNVVYKRKDGAFGLIEPEF